MKVSEAIQRAIDNNSGINAHGCLLLALEVERAQAALERQVT